MKLLNYQDVIYQKQGKFKIENLILHFKFNKLKQINVLTLDVLEQMIKDMNNHGLIKVNYY